MKYIILVFVIFLFPVPVEDLEEIEGERLFVEKYLSTLSLYMGGKNNKSIHQLELLNMMYDSDTDYPCDLFNNENDIDFNGYLIEIDQAYKNDIEIDYNILKITKCRDVSNGRNFSYIFINKTLSYKKKKNIVNLLFTVSSDNDSYKVNSVEWLNKESIHDDDCLLGEYNSIFKSLDVEGSIAIRLNEWRAIGDQAFNDGNYSLALSYYKEYLKLKKDIYVENRVSECLLVKHCKEKYGAGLDFLDRKDYKRAINIFQSISESCDDLKVDASNMLEISVKKLNLEKFNNYKNIADSLFINRVYSKSKEFYLKALDHDKNNSYIKTQIEICRDIGPKHELNEIKRAIRLAEQNYNNFAEAFAIMYKHEASGFLNGENYHFMANVLDGDDDNVGKHMKFSRKERSLLSKIYCINAIERGYTKAEEMWVMTFNKKIENIKKK